MAKKRTTGTDFWDENTTEPIIGVGGYNRPVGVLTRPGFANSCWNSMHIRGMTDGIGNEVTSKFYLRSGEEGVASTGGMTNTIIPPRRTASVAIDHRTAGESGWMKSLFLTGKGANLPWKHVNSILSASLLGDSRARYRINQDSEAHRFSLQRASEDGWKDAVWSDIIPDKDDLGKYGLSPDTPVAASYSNKPRKGSRLLRFQENMGGLLTGMSDRGTVSSVFGRDDSIAEKIVGIGDDIKRHIIEAIDSLKGVRNSGKPDSEGSKRDIFLTGDGGASPGGGSSGGSGGSGGESPSPKPSAKDSASSIKIVGIGDDIKRHIIEAIDSLKGVRNSGKPDSEGSKRDIFLTGDGGASPGGGSSGGSGGSGGESPSPKPSAKDSASSIAQTIGKAIRHPFNLLSTVGKNLHSDFVKTNPLLKMGNRFLRRFGLDIGGLAKMGPAGAIVSGTYAVAKLLEKFDDRERSAISLQGSEIKSGAKEVYSREHYGITSVQEAKFAAAASEYGLEKEGSDLAKKIFGQSKNLWNFDRFADAMGKSGLSMRYNDSWGNALTIGKGIKDLREASKNGDVEAFSKLDELRNYFGGENNLNAIEKLYIKSQEKGSSASDAYIESVAKRKREEQEKKKHRAERENKYGAIIKNTADAELLAATDTDTREFWGAPEYGQFQTWFNWTAGMGGSFAERTTGLAAKAAEREEEWDKLLSSGENGAIGSVISDMDKVLADNLRPMSWGALQRFKGYNAPGRMANINSRFVSKMGRNMTTEDILTYRLSREGSDIDNDEESIDAFIEKIQKGADYVPEIDKWNKNPEAYKRNFDMLDVGSALDFYGNLMKGSVSSWLPAPEVGLPVLGFGAAIKENTEKAKEAAESGADAVGRDVTPDGKVIQGGGEEVQNTFNCTIQNTIENSNASAQEISEETRRQFEGWMARTFVCCRPISG